MRIPEKASDVGGCLRHHKNYQAEEVLLWTHRDLPFWGATALAYGAS